jgi:Tfp pilus assembly protein PilZ
MDSWRPAAASHAAATGLAPRRRRRHYRHEIQTLAYLNLDQSNGGIIRNLGDSGVAVQAVAPVRVDQQVFLRFELVNPRVRIEGTGRVAWADPMGQAGIEFLALAQRSRRGLKEWIFTQLLNTAQATAESNFTYGGDTADELLFSPAPRPAIRFETAVSLTRGIDQNTRSLHLPWFPFAISAQALAYLVDGLILLSAVLLFAVICMAMIGAVPAWPITLILGMGASAAFAILYRFLFRFWIGGTPGAHLAGLTNDARTGMNREADERPRFR